MPYVNGDRGLSGEGLKVDRLTPHILCPTASADDDSCCKIVSMNKLLTWTKQIFTEQREVEPIERFVPGRTQAVEEIEAINVCDDAIHSLGIARG